MLVSSQVCDSDTVLDPACTIEMLKILEEDPRVGGVGGDVQVKYKILVNKSTGHKRWNINLGFFLYFCQANSL